MDDAEIWKVIPGWEGYYEASSHGRVRSLPRVVNHPRSWKLTIKSRILRSQPHYHGYRMVPLSREGSREIRTIHSLVAEAFLGPCPDGQEVRHLDGIADNCRVGNLKYGTKLENCADMIRHGKSLAGTRNPNAKLTESAVAEVRKAGRNSCALFAKRYGMRESSVRKAFNRETWRHVP